MKPQESLSESLSVSLSSDSSSSSDNEHPDDEDGSKYLSTLRVRPIDPHFWNGLRWRPCGTGKNSMQLNKKLQGDEISVISWNVWFGMRHRTQRMQALGKVIQSYEPDFVFLQEVTSDIMREISSQQWTRSYYQSDPEAKLVNRYGNCMLSKYKFHECCVQDLESQMGRKMMLGSVVVQNSPQLLFGTFHLESDPQDTLKRAKQLKEFREATSKAHYCFLCGDTNFVVDSESEILDDRFGDVWKDLYPDKPGLTFDTVANSMAKEEYVSMGRIVDKQKRLDRLFYTKETIEPISMEIIGTQPYWKTEYISDHFGIYVRLRLKH